ncbi:MAG: hypothetical protein ACK457_10700 [Flavobacteriia bacterium]|jgi:hypothetical protein
MSTFELGGTQVTGSVSATNQLTATFAFCDGGVGNITYTVGSATTYKSGNTTILKIGLSFATNAAGTNKLTLDLTRIGVSGVTADAIEMVMAGRPKPDPRIIVIYKIPL